MSWSTAARDSMWLSQSVTRTAAFTSCDHLLGGYLPLFCFLPFINLSLISCIPSLSSHISPVTPPPCFLPQLPPCSEFTLWSNLLSSPLFSLRNFLPTLKVSQELLFFQVRTFWKIVSVQFAETAVRCQRAETSLNINGLQIVTRTKWHHPGRSCKHLDCDVENRGRADIKRKVFMSPSPNALLLFLHLLYRLLWVSEWRWPSFRTTSG